MNLLWTSDALVSAVSGRPVGTMPEGVTGISIDSRTLKPGEAFFAIKGDRFDGHDYATAAMKAGASLLVVAESRLPALGRVAMPMIVVPDVLDALRKAGIAARARARARIIAVTGSAGKTTTKDMLREVLSASGSVHAADRSFNNHWGVPLTLARMPADSDFAIFEIGMNHAGEISPLTQMVRPHIAIITLIAAAHLGNFASLDDIARAKAEIFEGVEKGGHALINRDDKRWKLLEKSARAAGVENVWGFGENSRATFKLLECHPAAEDSTVKVRLAGEEHEARIGAPGRHLVQNAMAVMGAAYLAGADMPKVMLAFSGIRPATGRGRRYRLAHPQGEFTLIDESYNANPASMKAAIDLMDAAPVSGSGRRIAVLGDMLELGKHSQRLHADLADLVAASKADLVLLAGEEMRALAANAPAGRDLTHFETIAALEAALLKAVGPGDVVMVKSSNGICFSKLVEALLKKYPEAGAVSRSEPAV
ncbi:MAG: UDP-N-acetylmuramoylalanyl-D-glutamyl-2,6-diaminopimelate--D-alanyl-D-alanine ligase [Aliihoeflea sp.]